MMDRELLEAAAKAAQLEGEHLWAGDAGISVWTPQSGARFWNPLTDDGDALRLAVKLNLQVTHYGDCVGVGKWDGTRQEVEEWTGMTGADPYAATRRAIVRAAASIRRAGKES
jgi:hypothetical protein